MKFIFLIVASLNLTTANSQKNNLLDFYKLDTIIDTKILVDYSDFTDVNYNLSIYKNNLMIYIPSYKEDDSLRFSCVNMNNYTVNNMSFYVKNLSDKITTPYLYSFSFNDSFLVIYSTYKNLIGFNIVNRTKLIDTVLEGCVLEKIKLINNKIILTSTYNLHPKMCEHNTEIKVISIPNLETIRDTFLNNIDKEFSHYNPHSWISVSDQGNIMFTLSTQYKFFEYNSNLELLSTNVGIDSNFKGFPINILNNFYSINKEYNPKSLITFLKPFDNSLSRIERVHYLSNSEMFISKIPRDISKSKFHRLFDFYTLVDNKWKIKYSNIIEYYPEKDTKLFKNNFPMNSAYSSKNSLFDGKYYLILEASSVANYFNKSKNEFQKELVQNEESNLTCKLLIFKTD